MTTPYLIGLVSENSGGIVAYLYDDEVALRAATILNGQETTCEGNGGESVFWVMDLDENNMRDYEQSALAGDFDRFGDSPVLNMGFIFRDNEEKDRILAAINPRYLNGELREVNS